MDHGERGARAYNGSMGVEPSAGAGAERLMGGQGAKPLKMKVFCPFLTKEEPKVKDLNLNKTI